MWFPHAPGVAQHSSRGSDEGVGVVKISAKVITHARYTAFQMAEVAVPRDLFRRILDMIDDLRPRKRAPG
jgi:hypothetical protein